NLRFLLLLDLDLLHLADGDFALARRRRFRLAPRLGLWRLGSLNFRAGLGIGSGLLRLAAADEGDESEGEGEREELPHGFPSFQKTAKPARGFTKLIKDQLEERCAGPPNIPEILPAVGAEQWTVRKADRRGRLGSTSCFSGVASCPNRGGSAALGVVRAASW